MELSGLCAAFLVLTAQRSVLCRYTVCHIRGCVQHGREQRGSFVSAVDTPATIVVAPGLLLVQQLLHKRVHSFAGSPSAT